MTQLINVSACDSRSCGLHCFESFAIRTDLLSVVWKILSVIGFSIPVLSVGMPSERLIISPVRRILELVFPAPGGPKSMLFPTRNLMLPLCSM